MYIYQELLFQEILLNIHFKFASSMNCKKQKKELNYRKNEMFTVSKFIIFFDNSGNISMYDLLSNLYMTLN